MSESEVLSIPPDKRKGRNLPGDLRARRGHREPGQGALWTAPACADFKPEPVWGQFPKGFLEYATKLLRAPGGEVLHMCSGALSARTGRARVDIRPAAAPDVVADARRLPFPDATFAAALIDPPYTTEYARDLYREGFPRPSHLLREASRVVRPCGRLALLHFYVPMPPPGCRLELVRGITTGCGYRIRALTVFVRDQDELPLEAGA